jgi:hypothetical protein
MPNGPQDQKRPADVIGAAAVRGQSNRGPHRWPAHENHKHDVQTRRFVGAARET